MLIWTDGDPIPRALDGHQSHRGVASTYQVAYESRKLNETERRGPREEDDSNRIVHRGGESRFVVKMDNRRACWLPIPRLNESFHLTTAKVEFGTCQRGKLQGIPKWKGKGQFQTKDPISRGKLPGVQVSSLEGLCPPKAAFFLLPCNEPKGERQGSVSRFKVTSQSNCTSERRKSRLRATRCNVSKVTELSERGICCFAHPTIERVYGEGLSCVIANS
ncbi:hypothetical protein EZV62_012177 [Acer yangbiense]|uniref:Uncharacterized protein n=1 Tax=Acer yangbiense TaxID=1000413 RepID=A0A5C7HVI3_9ROSI|nr:hypothetical protein EZV62_012177 [Acer yangbiense]